MKNEWSKISLVFLFLVALIGTLLRSITFIPIPLQYTHLVHAHSHVAFQGWVYTIMTLLLINTYLNQHQINKGRYPLQFKLTVVIIFGVLVSFSLQGYALYSIIFSTLFQLLNYWFIYQFFKDIKSINVSDGKAISLRFIKTGIWLGLLSTSLPYGIGILSAKGLNGTQAYQSLVYTFLHLQYNGWFLFVVLGLFFNFLDNNNIPYNQKYFGRFYWLLSIAIIPAIALTLLGMDFSQYVEPPAYIAAGLISIALLYFIMALPRNVITALKHQNNWFTMYCITFLISFTVKMILQCLSVFSIFKPYAFHNKSIIIAYLHLSLIGSVSFWFFAQMIEKKWLPVNILLKFGSVLLIVGFLITELLLLFSGLGLFHDQSLLIIASMAMAFGILLIIFSGNQNNTVHPKTT